MNRTIKTIAGAAVLMSAVSLVPAFSVNAMTFEESIDSATTAPASTVFARNASDAKKNSYIMGDQILFAYSDAEDADGNAITDAAIVLDDATEVTMAISEDTITFTTNGTATIKDGALLANNGSYKIVYNFNGGATKLYGAQVTVDTGASLVIGASTTLKGNTTSEIIVKNGGTLTIKKNTINFNKVTNSGVTNFNGNNNTVNNVVNNGVINVAKGGTTTIAADYASTAGSINVYGTLDVTAINDLSEFTINLFGDNIDTNEDGITEGISTGIVKTQATLASDKKANIVKNAIDFVAADAIDNDFTWAIDDSAPSITGIKLTATVANYSATVIYDSNSQTVTTKNTNTVITDFEVGGTVNVLDEEGHQVYEENGITPVTRPKTLEDDLNTFLATSDDYNYIEGWNVVDKNGKSTYSATTPILIDGYRYYADLSHRNTINYVIALPDVAEEDWEVKTVLTSNDNHTFNDFMNSLEDLPEGYTWTILTGTLLGDLTEVDGDHELVDNAIVVLKATPAPEEPEVKTIDLTVTAGDNTMTVEGYELSEGVNTYGDLADLFKNNEEITSLGTIETVTVLVDGEEANLEDEIVAGATVTIVITFESNDQPEPEQPEITEPSLEVSGSVDLKDADKALETIKSSLDKDENILTRWGVESAIAAGEQVDFVVESTKIEDVDAETAAAVAKKAGDRKILGYYDIEVVAKAGDREIGKLSTLDSTIALRIKLSEEDRKVAEGYERTYVVVRVHGADVTILEATLDEEGYLNFESSLFSTYAVAYTDVKKASVRPVTPNPDKKPVIEVPEGTTPNDAGFIASEKSATSASIFAGLAAIVTAAGIAIAKLFKKSER